MAPPLRVVSGALAIALLAVFSLQLFRLAFSRHLLVVDDVSDAVLDGAAELFDLALRALARLRRLAAGLTVELLRAALGLHGSVTDELPNALLDGSANLLGSPFALFAFVAHWNPPSLYRSK